MLIQLFLASSTLVAAAASDDARIVVDAARVEGQIDPRLYGQFAASESPGPYGVEKDRYNKVTFKPVTTSGRPFP